MPAITFEVSVQINSFIMVEDNSSKNLFFYIEN
jgi:hypothetical protein